MAEPHWDDLKIFLAVARSENISRAGNSLRLDPATISRRIARLERVLEAALFHKSPQGYLLTEVGQKMRTNAEAMETAMLGLQDVAHGTDAGLRGQIRLGAPDGCANYLLPQVCRDICAANPGLDVQIVALPRVFNLSKREADMAITVSAPSTGRLTSQRITDYKLHLAASPDYLENAPALNKVGDLKHHKIIGYIPDLIFDKELDYLASIGAPKVDFGSNSVSVQVNLALAGAGIVIAHDFALPHTGQLRRVLTQQVSLTRSFYLVRHADDRGIARLNRFAAELTAGFKQEVARLEAVAAKQT